MARMIKSDRSYTIGIMFNTHFEDGSIAEHAFNVGDVIENLRYVNNGEIVTVTGKLASVNYTVNSKITWNKNNPVDTFANDIVIDSITLDASSEYSSKLINVPVTEVVEWEDENTDDKVVARVTYKPTLSFTMTLHYSDNTSRTSSIVVGDRFDKVRIFNSNKPDTLIEGSFEVMSFAYKLTNKDITFTGIAFKGIDKDLIVICDFDNLFRLNELYTYEATDVASFSTAMNKLADGDSLIINMAIDNSSESGALVIDGKKNVIIELDADVTTANSATSNFMITNSTVTFTGNAVVKASAGYDKNHSTTVIKLGEGADVTFSGPGIDTVLADANAGHFGVGVFSNGKLTVNSGNFNAGWYAVASNGTSQTDDGSITINDGVFTSAYDFCMYFPANYTYTINGGTFDGPMGAISINSGKLYINGGTFSTTGEGSKVTEVYSSDGTYNSITSCLNLNAKYGDVVCRITGGRFISGNNFDIITTGSPYSVDLKISGGEFSSKITDSSWLADGYVCTNQKNSNGFYEVGLAGSFPEELMAE